MRKTELGHWQVSGFDSFDVANHLRTTNKRLLGDVDRKLGSAIWPQDSSPDRHALLGTLVNNRIFAVPGSCLSRGHFLLTGQHKMWSRRGSGRALCLHTNFANRHHLGLLHLLLVVFLIDLVLGPHLVRDCRATIGSFEGHLRRIITFHTLVIF